jgi:hypothetical protein
MPKVEVDTNRTTESYCNDLLKYNLPNTPEDVRDKLKSFCLEHEHIPKYMNFMDGVIFYSALIEMGFLDMNHIDECRFDQHWSEINTMHVYTYDSEDAISFTCDEKGRIIDLTFDFFDFKERSVGWLDRYSNVSNLFGRLYRLKTIKLDGDCPLLSVEELSNLTQLDTLNINNCVAFFPTQTKLRHLKNFTIEKFELESIASPLLLWMKNQPSLEFIAFCGCDARDKKKTSSIIVDFFASLDDACFQDSLEQLYIHFFLRLTNDSLKTVMIDVLPKFTKLSVINLCVNLIESVQPIMNIINNNNGEDSKELYVTPSPKSQLRDLYLSYNPIFKNMKDDPVEKMAMLSFLQTFNTICNLGGSKLSINEIYNPQMGEYDRDIEYALRINHAGRSIIECKINASTDSTASTNDGGRSSSISLSMWPTILEHAYETSHHIYCWGEHDKTEKRSAKSADGLYYLCCNKLAQILNERDDRN